MPFLEQEPQGWREYYRHYLGRARRADPSASSRAALAGTRTMRLRADVDSGCNAVPHVAAHECAQGGRSGARPTRRAVGTLSTQSRGSWGHREHRRECSERDDGGTATCSLAADQQSSGREGLSMTNATLSDQVPDSGTSTGRWLGGVVRRPVGMGASVQPAGAVLGVGGLAAAGRSQELISAKQSPSSSTTRRKSCCC